jgi:hypothetical protein
LEEFENRHISYNKFGLSRVLDTARAVQKRNAAAVRALREARRSLKSNPSQSIEFKLVERIHELIMDMLNVDLAMLLAAATLAESPAMSAMRSLPALSSAWRQNASRWSYAMDRVRAIYFERGGHRNRERTLTFIEQPAWLRHVIESAPDLFPQSLAPR